jgi:hypothetical protein
MSADYQEEAGQDKPHKDGSECYDAYHGTYEQQEPATKAGENKLQKNPPFTGLKGGK